MVRKAAITVIKLCLLAIFLFSGYRLELKADEYRRAFELQSGTALEMREGRTVDFEKLKKRNDDVRGWIWLPDSNIDYPIVQGRDNDYYLHRDLDGEYLYDGSIFMDASVRDPFGKDTNTVIYGHHMFSGAMFCNLEKFADREYFDSHDVVVIETENGSYDMHVIAFCNEPSDSDLYVTDFAGEDAGGYFDEEFSGDEFGEEPEADEADEEGSFVTKGEFVALIRDKAQIMSDEEFSEDDVFVTLSTCAYNYDEARHQVIGVLKEAGTEEVFDKSLVDSFNRWRAIEIAVAVIMAAALILTLFSMARDLAGKK